MKQDSILLILKASISIKTVNLDSFLMFISNICVQHNTEIGLSMVEKILITGTLRPSVLVGVKFDEFDKIHRFPFKQYVIKVRCLATRTNRN